MKKKVYRLGLSFLFVLILGMIFGATGVSAADGYVTLSIEKFTLGKGYYMEPTVVPFEEGDTIADVTAAVLGDDNYLNTGSGPTMYFSYFRDRDNTAPNIPQYILRAIGKGSNGKITEADVLKKGKASPSWLGEFDYYSMSGWMICSNNYFIDVSTGAYPVQDGDVIRWQYTVYGYGADLGSAFMDPDFIISTANKDALTAEIAQINANEDKSEMLQNETFKRYYDNALFILETMTSTQEQVDMTLANLQGTSTEEPTLPDPDYVPADYNVLDVVETIDALPAADGVTLDDEDDITAAREAYDTLDEVDQQLVTNVSHLTAAEAALNALKNPAPAFTDIANHWAKADIEYLASLGIVNGKSEGAFAPDDLLTRAEFTKILALASGEDMSGYSDLNIFDDVAHGQWYQPYVNWANQKGIVKGVSANAFAPDEKISRQDMAVMMYRYADVTGISLSDGSDAQRFADDSAIAGYAKEAVYAMKASGIVNGVGENRFAPNNHATRAEASAIIHRLLLLGQTK